MRERIIQLKVKQKKDTTINYLREQKRTKNTDAPPVVDAAQNESLFPSSVNQRRPCRED